MNIFTSILILTIYFAIYGVIHSWLAGEAVKAWMRRTFGPSADRWYRLVYNIFAVITLLPMFALMAMLPGQMLYVAPSPWRWLMVGGQLLALLGVGIALLQTNPLHFVGVAQLFDAQPDQSETLYLGGFYTWVRHPLYTFSLIFLWLSPVMTTNTLAAFILFTLYFYFGSIYEERRLLAKFGQTYKAYQQQVPRLIPIPGRRYAPPHQ